MKLSLVARLIHVMKRVVMTKEIIKYWNILHREAHWTPHKPYCKLCSNLFFRRGHLVRSKSEIKYFAEGEPVYKVEFANRTVGYYHVECIDNPKDKWMRRKVETICNLDVDKWLELENFLKELSAQNLSKRQMIDKVKVEFNCSHSTAWRKVSAFLGD